MNRETLFRALCSGSAAKFDASAHVRHSCSACRSRNTRAGRQRVDPCSKVLEDAAVTARDGPQHANSAPVDEETVAAHLRRQVAEVGIMHVRPPLQQSLSGDGGTVGDDKGVRLCTYN